MHVGAEQCLLILRNQFWIPNYRGLIKNIRTFFIVKYNINQLKRHLCPIFLKKD